MNGNRTFLLMPWVFSIVGQKAYCASKINVEMRGNDHSEKIWRDANQLMDEYDFSLDIVHSNPEFNADHQ